jgi:hypothetical protein
MQHKVISFRKSTSFLFFNRERKSFRPFILWHSCAILAIPDNSPLLYEICICISVQFWKQCLREVKVALYGFSTTWREDCQILRPKWAVATYLLTRPLKEDTRRIRPIPTRVGWGEDYKLPGPSGLEGGLWRGCVIDVFVLGSSIICRLYKATLSD